MKHLLLLVLSLAVLAWAVFPAAAQPHPTTDNTIVLPKPDINGGKPLMQALAQRKATRDYNLTKTLSEQDISNLLWATWGANRSDGRRTAPTARNTQDVAVYIVMANGVWFYDGLRHELNRNLNQDYRERFGGAPVTLLYAAPPDDKFSGMHIGSLYQNAGLYCSSVGLGNVVKVSGVDALESELSLPSGYKVMIIQTIGWPK